MKNLLIILLSCLPLPALADFAIVDAVTATKGTQGWTFSVTLRHPDTGWDHYADGWQVLTPDGTSLGIRELAHPHVNEQPFTRSLSGVDIPADLTQVMIRARCITDGWSDHLFPVDLDG